jgi:uncharacterized protein (TIGR02145 family)
LGGIGAAGGAMKSPILWNAPNTGATNSSGFTAYGSGYRSSGGSFMSLGDYVYFWTSEAVGGNGAYCNSLSSTNDNVNVGSTNNKNGFTCRCVKD